MAGIYSSPLPSQTQEMQLCLKGLAIWYKALCLLLNSFFCFIFSSFLASLSLCLIHLSILMQLSPYIMIWLITIHLILQDLKIPMVYTETHKWWWLNWWWVDGRRLRTHPKTSNLSLMSSLWDQLAPIKEEIAWPRTRSLLSQQSEFSYAFIQN